MRELVEGSGVYWYPHQRAYCSAFTTWASFINAATYVFFTKEVLARSCAKGHSKKSKSEQVHEPLNQLIVETLVGR